MSSHAKCWIAGKIVDRSDANIPLSDLGLSRGCAAFDALRTYGGVPFLLDEHIERLEASCALLFLKPPIERKALSEIVHQTLAANEFLESLIRIFVTAGDAAGFIPEGNERLMVLVDPLRSSPPQQFTVGVGLATTGLGRTLPLAKSTSYIAGVRETIQARHEGFDEVVFCDENGSILEGTTFSVVSIIGDALVTPQADVLRGITVEHVLRLAAEEGLKITRAPISQQMLKQYDEMFITSSTRELVPVNRVDGIRIANGTPGPLTRRLHQRYLRSAETQCGLDAIRGRSDGGEGHRYGASRGLTT